MRISLASLTGHLAREASACYLVFGAETLLIEETVDALRAHLLSQGYNERLRYTNESGFDWYALTEQSQSLSLFAEKKIIELASHI